ncbi:ABC transporter substrate-binding protein [Rhodococcus erythropolis]|uniref:ABC transporter substrate-binding protein n=1 Tax=Rhodococcus erythropolis TaxID=1833 RepID=UPI00197CBBCB|nr:ABC transporter substrate-binding protein [Rhodococcus erythropolis]QSE41187.1 ABC transporter substrate-binding protein [Rhodococcus erythropolis]
MNTRFTRFCAIGAGLALAFTVAACGGSDSDAAAPSADGVTRMTLSIPPVGDSLPVYVALENGFFADNGLEIELAPAANGATTINALISGSTDLALVSYPSLIKAVDSKLPVAIAAMGIDGTDEYKAGIYVPEGSAVKTPADLIGKKVATPSLGSVGDIYFRGVLKDENLDYTKVNFVELPQANMATALKAGDVDAAFITEPTLSSAVKTLDLRAIGYQNGPQGVFATSTKTIDSNPDAIRGFRTALAQAVEVIEVDPHGVASQIMPKYTDMDAETARNMNLPQFVTEWNADDVQSVIDLMVEVGIIKQSFSADNLFQPL